MDKDFEREVVKQIRRLQEEPYSELSTAVTNKRRDWLQRRTHRIESPTTARNAYELFLLEYLGLTKESVPVVSETDDEIVWDSTNRCPTLEACQQLNLDTRRVCRQIYEKSTQAFLSALDPQLRFWRSYERIRPYTPSCREAIFKMDFEAMMRLAIDEAEVARSRVNVASGAVLVHCKEVISTGQDTVSIHHEPNAHAAMHAIHKATEVLGNADLCGGILFVTTEPCPTCVIRAVEANLTTIVFGVSAEDMPSLGETPDHVNCETVAKEAPNRIEIIGGILREECQALLETR